MQFRNNAHIVLPVNKNLLAICLQLSILEKKLEKILSLSLVLFLASWYPAPPEPELPPFTYILSEISFLALYFSGQLTV